MAEALVDCLNVVEQSQRCHREGEAFAVLLPVRSVGVMGDASVVAGAFCS